MGCSLTTKDIILYILSMDNIIQCSDCGIDIVKYMTRIRCKKCQEKANYNRSIIYRNTPERKAYVKFKNEVRREERRKAAGLPPSKNTQVMCKDDYLKYNKPNMIAFLKAYTEDNMEDIDLTWCLKFCDYIKLFYPPGQNEITSLMDEVNYYISLIINEYSK